MTDVASFVAVRVQGGLLPADLLSRLATGKDLNGLSSSDYHLAAGESVREAANRVWAYLRGVWTSYREALERLPATDRATTLTRERWLLILLDQLGYGRVPLTGAGGLSVDGRSFPISHVWQSVPIDLLGDRVDLDHRTPGLAGAAGASPQSLVQELLNHSDRHLWGILSNGRTLRLLRDSTSLVGSAYVEFDLEAIFEGDLFADFLLLYTLCHQSRVEVRDQELGPSSCWLEIWRQTALESGTRALDQLRRGVIEALTTLGAGFLSHPHNAELRSNVENGTWSIEDIHHGLLRVVYRLLFTFVAEDRGALLDPGAPLEARVRYHQFFSTNRLRQIARRRNGGRHGDRWRSLCLVWEGLGSRAGRPELGIIGIGGLFEPGELDVLGRFELSNEALLSAVRSLSLVREQRSGFQRVVDHRNLGAEELGSIYESLLEYMPRWDAAAKQYQLDLASGNARKTSGSYYTPTSLIDCLLDSALDPVLDDAQKNADDPEAALLGITVCDPACGSGHFLVAAARRIAKRVAALRTGDPEPAPEAVRSVMRDVVSRCIYGVDINPLAAELAKVSLWLEAFDRGQPMAFLDAQIKIGNALIGATPALLAEGIPDAAFKPIEDDDKRYAAELAKQNKRERSGQESLFEVVEPRDVAAELSEQARALIGKTALSLSDVHVQQQRLRTYVSSPGYLRARDVADAWCAAIVWPKRASAPKAVTHQVLVDLAEQPERVLAETRKEIARLAAEYRFFHWHLEFPHVFRGDELTSERDRIIDWSGGFHVVLGNPPWERVALEDNEFFATRMPGILKESTTAKRKLAIARLETTHPTIHEEYSRQASQRSRVSAFYNGCGIYLHTATGRLNTQSLFAERSLGLLRRGGAAGLIVPTGVIADIPSKGFWTWLVKSSSIRRILDFENSEGAFPGVHRSTKFSLITFRKDWSSNSQLQVGVYFTKTSQLLIPGRIYGFPLDSLGLLNPITNQLPISRTQRDIDLLIDLHQRTLPGLSVRPWVGFTSESNSSLFLQHGEREDLVRLWEGKMMHQYDPAFASYELSSPAEKKAGKPREVAPENKGCSPASRFYAERSEVERFLLRKGESRSYIFVVRDYARASDDRTAIAAIVPRTVPIQPLNGFSVDGEVANALWAIAAINSLVYDWIAKQKTPGQHFNVTTMAQVPVPTVDETWMTFVASRALQLSLGLPELNVLLEDCQSGSHRVDRIDGPRYLLRAELDAFFFHVYGVTRDDVSYIMDSFTITRKRERRQFGEFRTKSLVLELWDTIGETMRSGVLYEPNRP